MRNGGTSCLLKEIKKGVSGVFALVSGQRGGEHTGETGKKGNWPKMKSS